MENNINQRLLGAHQKPASFMLVRGWKSSNGSPLPVEGEIFFLTFPFIDQAIPRKYALFLRQFGVDFSTTMWLDPLAQYYAPVLPRASAPGTGAALRYSSKVLAD